MSELKDKSLLLRIPLLMRQLPGDLVVTGGFSVIAAIAYSMSSLAGSVVLPIIGLPLLLFVPGYTVVAIALPTAAHAPTPRTGSVFTARRQSVDIVERLGLSFAMSIAFVPPVMVFGWMLGLTLETAPLALAGIGVLGSIVGTLQRLRVPPTDRFAVPYRRWLRELYSGLFGGGVVDGVINLALLVSVVVAATTIGYAFVVPNDGDAYSGLYLGTEGESGQLVMADYPSEFTSGEPQELIVGVKNNESARTSYTLVVELQRVQTSESSLTVLERQELERFQLTLDEGERWEHQHTIAPEIVGDDLRVQYRLYKGSAPADGSADSAYRTVHIWITVAEATS